MKRSKHFPLLIFLLILLTFTGCTDRDLSAMIGRASSAVTSEESLTSERLITGLTELLQEEETDASSKQTETSSKPEITTKVESGEATLTSKRYNTLDVPGSSAEETSISSFSALSSTDTAGSATTEKDSSSKIRLSDIFKNDILSNPITQKEAHGSEFFNDAVFVGDSITVGLEYYVNNERKAGRECLGTAQFLCAGSMSYTNSRGAVGAAHSIHPEYNGQEVLIEDGIKQCGAKKVFLMLGMNDFLAYNMDKVKSNIRDTIDKIKSVNPDVRIYIESVTPITSGKEHDNFTNENIDSFNQILRGIAGEYGLRFVDINSQLKGSDGYLKPEYCGDNGEKGMGIHMSAAGSKAWINYLINNF